MLDLFGCNNAPAQLLLDERMIFRKLAEFPTPKLADSAISDVRPEGGLSSCPECDDGRRHARTVFPLLGGMAHLEISEQHGRAQGILLERCLQAVTEGPTHFGRSAYQTDKVIDRADGQPGRNRARCVPTQTVGHN